MFKDFNFTTVAVQNIVKVLISFIKIFMKLNLS